MDNNKLLAVSWEQVDGDVGQKLKDELIVEIGNKHELSNTDCKVVARSRMADDILCYIPRSKQCYIIAHLTYSHRLEKVEFLGIEYFDNFNEVLNSLTKLAP